jgi:hypothetical protein
MVIVKHIINVIYSYDKLMAVSVVACMGRGKLHQFRGDQGGIQGKKSAPLYVIGAHWRLNVIQRTALARILHE